MELTKYEKARIVGARSLQIAMGAPFMIDIKPKELEQLQYNPIRIAMKELEADALKIKIKPLMPQKP